MTGKYLLNGVCYADVARLLCICILIIGHLITVSRRYSVGLSSRM